MASEELKKLSIENSPSTVPQSASGDAFFPRYSSEKKVETSAGMETASETVSRVKSALANPTENTTPSVGRMSRPRPAESNVRDPEQIQKELMRSAQGEINALNEYYQGVVSEQREYNEERSRGTSSVNTLTGLAGSTEANVQTQKTDKQNQADIKRIRDEQNLAIQSVLGNVRKDALDQARFERQEARLDSETAIAERQALYERAITNVSALAASGVTPQGFAETDPDGYHYLANQVGGEAVLQSMFTLNRPQEQILDKRIEGGKYVIAFQNPLDGNVRIETVDLGLPTGYSKTVDAGNRILAIPDNWSGDPSELITINKGLTPSEQISSSSGGPSGDVARDADSIMAGVLNLTDVSTKDNYRSLVSNELKRRADEAKSSGDIFGTMKASAAYDKEVSDTFLQSAEKVLTVLGQLGTLQQNISGTDTGPIVGAFRAANPWDTNAQTIKAQLNAIVPNLARGVYGEVGVLTDNDIRTYSKTLPNLTSTEAVRNAILYITVDMIRNNFKKKIENQVAGQRDMSGYADIYRELQQTSTQILSSIPGADVSSGAESAGMKVLISPDGSQFDASDLTDDEYEQALSEGFTPA